MPCTASFIRGLFWGFLIYTSIERIEGLILRNTKKKFPENLYSLPNYGRSKVSAKADPENPSFDLKIHIRDLSIGEFAITEQPLGQCGGIETHQYRFPHFTKSIPPLCQIRFEHRTCFFKDFSCKIHAKGYSNQKLAINVIIFHGSFTSSKFCLFIGFH